VEEKEEEKGQKGKIPRRLSLMQKLELFVTNTATYIRGSIRSEDYNELKKVLGYRPPNADFMVQNFNEKQKDNTHSWEWDGTISTVCYPGKCRCYVKKKGMHFPTGLLGKARTFFLNREIRFKIVDGRKPVLKTLSLSMSSEFEQRPYQKEVVDKACERGRGIIKVATGGGKSVIAANIIQKLGVSPFIFYVTSVDLMLQAQDSLQNFITSNGSNLKVGIIGDSKFDIKDINVMTIQTAIRSVGEKWTKFDDEDTGKEDCSLDDKRKEIRSLIITAKGLIIDECQHWAAKTCQVISDYSMSARYKIAMSATPHRDLGDDILIDACFGREISDINASFLIKKGYLVKPRIFLIPITNNRGIGLRSYPRLYKRCISHNDVRNSVIVNIAKNFEEDNRNILILCKHIEHGKLLQSSIPGSTFLRGLTSSKKRKQHLGKMRKKEAGITVATVIFDEGIDCKSLDTLILAGSGKSKTRALQRIGRILRPYPGKKDAIVVDFIDHARHMLSHSKERIKMYKSELEFDISTLKM